jgi:hypothetical protein
MAPVVMTTTIAQPMPAAKCENDFPASPPAPSADMGAHDCGWLECLHSAAAGRNTRLGSEESVRGQVHGLLARLFPRDIVRERRHDGRYPFPFLIHLTPVDPRTLVPLGEAIVVVGKDLSERGLGFYHQGPLPYRRAIVTFDQSGGQSVSLLLDLSWCRFTRYGWYDSGGRFLQVIQPCHVAS